METQFIDLTLQIFRLFRKGDLIGLKQLYELNPNIVSAFNQDAFCWACADGDLHIAQWLLQVKPDINISAYNEKAFRYACEGCQLDVCKWLLQVSKEKGQDINISALNEYAFRIACSSGHLEVCKWLLQVKPDIDISALDDSAFYSVCYKAHLQVPRYLQVAKWLQSLKPYLYVIEYDEDGTIKDYKIRSKEEANWEKRKYLLWLASNNCAEENKTNLLYKLPSDVSRMVIGFV